MIVAASAVTDPVEALHRLAVGERPFFLDGSSDADGLGRCSFAGCDPAGQMLWSLGDRGDPYALLEGAAQEVALVPAAGPWPQWIGFVTYDVGAHLLAQRCGRVLPNSVVAPSLGVDFARYPAVLRWDHRSGRAEIVADDHASLERLAARLAAAPPEPVDPPLATLMWQLEKADYCRRAQRVIDYLVAGDLYQANLSQRLVCEFDEADSLGLFVRLREQSPAPLGFFLRGRDRTILGNSPELLLRIRGNQIETRPIKGTCARDGDGGRDQQLGQALKRSEKDCAEHLMIVDLERNDLGRVAETGSVSVQGFARVVTLPTVHHLVSTVQARLRDGVGLREVLAATFPGGSITGAPKLRAIEIIDELEASPRGVYCGALGWIGSDGGERAVDFALPIRTASVQHGQLVLPVGGGIVADSTPESEWQETRTKAAAFVRALSAADVAVAVDSKS